MEIIRLMDWLERALKHIARISKCTPDIIRSKLGGNE